MRPAAILFAFLCLSGTVGAQRWVVSQNLTRIRVIGLLDLPDLTRNFSDAECRSTESVGLQVYGTASTAGAVLGTVYKRNHPEFKCALLFKRAATSTEEELPSEESGSEIAAAVVHERRGRWFRIAVRKEQPGSSAPTATIFSPIPSSSRSGWPISGTTGLVDCDRALAPPGLYPCQVNGSSTFPTRSASNSLA